MSTKRTPTDRSLTAFLKSEAFRDAASYSGNSDPAQFAADSDGRVGIGFGGHYTVDEVKAKLADLERVQNAFDMWAARLGPKVPNPPHAPDMQPCKRGNDDCIKGCCS